MITFKEFKDSIDRSLKQSENKSRASVADSYRIATSDEIKDWVNDGIKALSNINDSYWTRTIKHVPLDTSSTLIIPFYIKELRRIYVDGTWYTVHHSNVEDADVWWNGGYEIEARNFSFTAGSEIKLTGTLFNNSVEDDNSVIDFPEAFIKLLKLEVLINAAARDEKRKTVWFAQKQIEEARFKSAVFHVSAVGRTEPSVGFGA